MKSSGNVRTPSPSSTTAGTAWGPFVQAGVARFLDERSAQGDEHRFRLLADVAPSLGRANLGTVYKAREPLLEDIVWAFARRFSKRMDLLRLLEREDELLQLQTASLMELETARERTEHLEAEIKHVGKELIACRSAWSTWSRALRGASTAPLRRVRKPRGLACTRRT